MTGVFMEQKKERCRGACNCPCYPNCDQMLGGHWKPEQTVRPQMRQLDQNPDELRELARQDEEDLIRLKEMYPPRIRQILEEVERVCDSMEYEGSVMFDEMPEKQRIQALAKGIEQKMQDRMGQWEEDLQQQQEEDIYVMNHRMAPPPPPPGPPYPPRRVNWFGDLIQVLLQDEMYHRRCRNRNCRRW